MFSFWRSKNTKSGQPAPEKPVITIEISKIEINLSKELLLELLAVFGTGVIGSSLITNHFVNRKTIVPETSSHNPTQTEIHAKPSTPPSPGF